MNGFDIRNIFFLITFLMLGSCKEYEYLPTVKEVDLNRYQGIWYEITRLPNPFEEGLKCITATYTLKDQNIEVINKGYRINDEDHIEEQKGTAWVPNPNFKGRLKVTFFWPFAGDYYIIYLDQNYRYVLVGEPSRQYLWILSRAPVLDQSIYKKLISIGKQNGFDTEQLIFVKQDC